MFAVLIYTARLGDQRRDLQDVPGDRRFHPLAVADDVLSPGRKLHPVVQLAKMNVGGPARVFQANHFADRRARNAYLAGDLNLRVSVFVDEALEPLRNVDALVTLQSRLFV